MMPGGEMVQEEMAIQEVVLVHQETMKMGGVEVSFYLSTASCHHLGFHLYASLFTNWCPLVNQLHIVY